MNSSMTADNHSSLQVRIKKVDVHAETGLTASRTVQKVINLLQLTQKSNGKKKYLVMKPDLFFFHFLMFHLPMGSSFVGHYMRYLHKCKTTNTYIKHVNLHKNVCHLCKIYSFFISPYCFTPHDSF